MAKPTGAEAYARRHRRALLVASAFLFAATVAVWVVARNGPLPGELGLRVDIVQHAGRAEVAQLAQFAVDLAAPAVAVITVVFGAGIALRRAGTRAALLVLAASGVVVVTEAAKSIAGHTLAFEQVAGRAAESFPSGHVSYVTAVLGSFAWLGWWHRGREISGVALLLVLIVGPATVARGAHVPSDVLAGYLVGAGWLLICIAAAGYRRTDS